MLQNNKNCVVPEVYAMDIPKTCSMPMLDSGLVFGKHENRKLLANISRMTSDETIKRCHLRGNVSRAMRKSTLNVAFSVPIVQVWWINQSLDTPGESREIEGFQSF